jgi:cytochrome P450
VTQLEPFGEKAHYQDPAGCQDPAGLFARLGESRPVAPMPGHDRAWLITRYADVRSALTNPLLAKDVHNWPGGRRCRASEAGGVHAHMLNSDPPVHTRLRRLTRQAFTPHRVAQLRPRTQQIAAGLLDEMAVSLGGVVDLLDAYARPLPVTVLCELLGIPAADHERMRVAVADYDRPEEVQRVARELGGYFTELIAAKRAEPGDDLLSALALARTSGHGDGGEDSLTSSELRCTAFQLLMAGFDTTVNLIASGTLALLTNPEEMARLREDPTLLPAAVEELLRFTNPLNHATTRFTTEDLTAGDVTIPAGTWVFLATSSANRDPARFPHPDRLDLGRDTSGHLAFGYGIHYCLGASLARMEAEVAFGALLARFPGMSLAVAPDKLRWRPVVLINGLESLPVHLA